MTGCYTCGGGMGKHDPVAHDEYSDEEIGGLGSGPRYPVPEDARDLRAELAYALGFQREAGYVTLPTADLVAVVARLLSEPL